MESIKKLSNLQLEILQLFQFDLTDEQLTEIKVMLAQYFADKLSNEMDALFDENSWGEEKIDEWGKEHMRTKYENQ